MRVEQTALRRQERFHIIYKFSCVLSFRRANPETGCTPAKKMSEEAVRK